MYILPFDERRIIASEGEAVAVEEAVEAPPYVCMNIYLYVYLFFIYI
jgi:hypothetical protein